MPSPRWILLGTLRITPFVFPLSVRSNPAQEDAIAAKVEVCIGRLAQAQVSEVGTGQRVAPDVQAADRFVADQTEAGPEQVCGDRRRRPIGDEVDFMHIPGVAVGGVNLEGAGREVVAQRYGPQGPGGERPPGPR